MSALSMQGVEYIVRQSLFIIILLMEIYGSFIIFFSANRIFILFVRTTRDGTEARLNLAGHLAMGLEFLLAAEIIRTIVVRSWMELQILAAVLLLRAILSVLIIWEIKQG
jgi:uncharacterized membrane protein